MVDLRHALQLFGYCDRDDTALRTVIGIYDGRWGPAPEADRSLSARFRRACWYKANPRNQDYMRRLFAEFEPDGLFLDVERDRDWLEQLRQADEIVLLYPDATGLGCTATQCSILRRVLPIQDIRVLNGRRRRFRLDRATRLQLSWRRLLERWMPVEFLMMPLLLGAALWLALRDRYRGARDLGA